jgi:hypothetical protein
LPLPEVTAKITIMGACTDGPCVIDGKGMGQIFVVGISGTLTLKNLEITGGMCSEGSAVLVAGNVLGGGGRLLALNVLFYNNTASVTQPPPPQNSSTCMCLLPSAAFIVKLQDLTSCKI